MRGGLITAAMVAVCALMAPTVAAQGGKPAAPSETKPEGTVTGTVTDKESGKAIADAVVELSGRGTSDTTRTDAKGKFSFKAPQGLYQVRALAPLHQPSRLRVAVQGGTETQADLALAGSRKGVQVVAVVAKAKRASEAAALARRQQATTVGENVSAETIKKSTDSDVAEVVQRATGVTVRDDRYMFVRGLNERYNQVLLNRSRISSTDPEKKVVPLDLFPSAFVEQLEIAKTFSPDEPGDWAGGLSTIELKSFPEQFHANFGMAGGYNLDVTTKNFATYKRTGLQYFTFGKNERELPGLFGENIISGIPSPARQRQLASSLGNIWDTDTIHAAPNGAFDFGLGTSYGPVGFELGGLYDSTYSRKSNFIKRKIGCSTNQTEGCGDNVIFQEDFRGNVYSFESRLAGIMSSTWKVNDSNDVTLSGFLNRGSQDAVRLQNGNTFSAGPEVLLQQTELRYTEEELAYGQLRGEHRLPWIQLDWRSAFTRTTQDVPDTRQYGYSSTGGSTPKLGQATRAFQTMTETLTDTGADGAIPFPIWKNLLAKFRLGGAYAYRDRSYDLRVFKYLASGRLTLPPEEILDPKNAGRSYTFTEITQPRDPFAARNEIAAGYGMFDLPLWRDIVKLSAGVRLEYSIIRVNVRDQQNEPFNPLKHNLDPLPAVTLITTPRPDTKITAAWSQTVARPELRELSSSIFPVQGGDYEVQGNPDLVQSSSENYDLRWEWFFAPTELTSLGFFYKNLDKPIEYTFLPQGSRIIKSFVNRDSATIWGFEAEARKDFAFVHPFLRYLSLTANFSWIESSVTLGEGLKRNQEQLVEGRQLQGQPPFVANGALEWTHPEWGTLRLLYNTTGRNIDISGTLGLGDLYFERRNQLDFVAVMPLARLGLPMMTVKFAAENIFNEPYVKTQQAVVVDKFTVGTKLSLGLSYAF